MNAGGLFVRIRPRLDDEHVDALEDLFSTIARSATEIVDACQRYRAVFAELERDPGADVSELVPAYPPPNCDPSPIHST